MNRLFTLISTLFVLYQASAQTTTDTPTLKFEHTNKGTHLAGGNIVLNNSFANSNQNNLFTLNINPNYGYFLANKFAIGGELSFLYSASSSSSTTPSTAYTRATLSPFVRYYVSPSQAWMFFAYGSAGGGWQNYNSQTVGVFTYQAGSGLDIFLNQHIAFETILSFTGVKVNTPNTDYNFNLGLKIGLQIFFNQSCGAMHRLENLKMNMEKSVKKYGGKFLLLLLLMSSISITSCRHSERVVVTPVVSGPVLPPLFVYNTFPYGQGTDYYSGAVTFEIDPISSYYNYAYFQVQIYGVGTYNLTGNQLFIPYLLPGSYPFTINIYCDNYTSSCPPESISGGFYIYQATTTQVLAQP